MDLNTASALMQNWMHAPVSVQALIDGWGCAPGPFLQNGPLACECMMMPCKERCDPSDSKAGIYCHDPSDSKAGIYCRLIRGHTFPASGYQLTIADS